MSNADSAAGNTLIAAVIAVCDLLEAGLVEFEDSASRIGLQAHSEIESSPIARKATVFYRHLVPLREHLVGLLADGYRQFFRLAVAHPSKTSTDPHEWAAIQLQPAIDHAVQWLFEWYALACDGENQSVRHLESVEFVPGGQASVQIPLTLPSPPPPTAWRAPSWLVLVSGVLVGIWFLKEHHVPNENSEEKLGKAHTRLLLKGARRVFLGRLGAVLETVRNQETAAAGAVREETVGSQKRKTIKREGWERRLKLYKVIQAILNATPGLEGIEFCAELDKRHAQPLLDWVKKGEWRSGLTWKEAWADPNLRRKIRRVRQEARKAILD